MNKVDVEMANLIRFILDEAVSESEYEAGEWAEHWEPDSPGVETSRKYADRVKAASDWFDTFMERTEQ